MVAVGGDGLHLFAVAEYTLTEKPLAEGSGWGYYAVAFSPDGSLLASRRYNDVEIWTVADGKLKGRPLEGHQGPVRSVAFSTNAQAG